MSKRVVLAFSGGLDTSYCVKALSEEGYDVVTYYAHSGSVEEDAVSSIKARAESLGSLEHHTVDIGEALFDEIVIPFLAGGARRQGRYPILCADRYLIAKEGVRLAEQVGADAIAHGCTGMGNDQVRFDISLAALSEKPILAPIRDIQDKPNVRAFEQGFLTQRGVEVPDRASKYSVNENLLGATLSGGPIDEWQAPGADARVLTAQPENWPEAPLSTTITFLNGVPTAVGGKEMTGALLLSTLNQLFGAYGVGYDIYTGDTLVGLKGRIVFEAPGLAALEAAHTALYEATASALQNGHRRSVGEAWTDLIYDGRFYDPLRDDLETYLKSSNRRATGTVTVTTHGGQVVATVVESGNILRREDAVYAQSAAWSGAVAEGFTQLSGQGVSLWHRSGDKDHG